jgi:hypothetical protein
VQAISHGNRGRKPKNAIPNEVKEKIIALRQTYDYEISNFKHFQELLKEKENIDISYSALYNILKNAGFKSPKKHRRKKLHNRRKRKDSEGMLLQADGTPFEWFGGKEKYSLHGFIDDATGKITGLYMCKNECLLGYLEVLRQTLTDFGIPISLYPDRANVFFSPKKDESQLTIEEQLAGIDKRVTQFGRIVEELGITMFPAYSSQAKGRIERLWETLQSRLTTEFRIHNITDMKQANEFLKKYIPKYNKQFSVNPSSEKNMFLELPKNVKLDELLCVKFERQIDNSGVFSIMNNKLQINNKFIPSKSKIEILISERIGMKAKYNGQLYSVTPLEMLSKDVVSIKDQQVPQYMSMILVDFINEYYLKDAKAS